MSTNRKSMMVGRRHGGTMPLARTEEIGSENGTQDRYPTAGEVFGEIGVTLAAFLAIALLANILATLLAV